MKAYAGIGTRNCPPEIYELMVAVAVKLASQGFVLRSGGADGCDSAFEEGCDRVGGAKEIYLPWKGFNGRWNSDLYLGNIGDENVAEQIASKFHPRWGNLTQGPRKLHTRNVYQCLGRNLLDEEKSKFVLVYTSDGQASGGSGQAMRIAKHYGIQILNFYDEIVLEKMRKYLDFPNKSS